MNARFVPLGFVAALLLAIGAIACGGKSLTFEEYSQRHEALTSEAAERSQVVEEDFDEETASADTVDELLVALRGYYNATLPIFEDIANGMKDLNPPAEIEDEHDALVEASADRRDSLQDLLVELADVESASELQDLFTEFGADRHFLYRIFLRLESSCLTLQDAATENSIDLDLDCGDE